MENVADALKMAGAALIFIIAFSTTMIMFSQARSTTDKIVYSLEIDSFFPKVEALGTNVTRIVGLETVIPTIYKYRSGDATLRVRILDEDGHEHQVFDEDIESTVYRMNIGGFTTDPDKVDYYNKLNERYATAGTPAYMQGAPWADQNVTTKFLERINAYIYGLNGTPHMNSLNYQGQGLLDLVDSNTNRFEESYVEYTIDGKKFLDTDIDEEIVITPGTTKTIITYRILPPS